MIVNYMCDSEEEGNVGIGHDTTGTCYTAAKPLQNELKESARLENTKLHQCAGYEQNRKHEDIITTVITFIQIR